MDWPSKNISRGGIFHSVKNIPTPEKTHFIKLLLDESKLSIRHRQKAEYFLRNGEPFPSNRSQSESRTSRIKEPLLVKPGSPRRRTRDEIIKLGLYEREQFVPQVTVNREKEKEKLQNKMAYGKDIAPQLKKKKAAKESEDGGTGINRFDQLANEIKERKEWLSEMEELGQGEKYRQIIEQQIQAKIQEINNLKSFSET